MATWQEIGYTAFCVLTDRLTAHGISSGEQQETPINYRLNVVEAGIRHTGDDWWEVVAQPDRGDVRSYDYLHGRLADAENDIEDHEKLKVLLLPVLPGD